MINPIAKLVDACVDAHVTAVSTNAARKQFRALIQHAYDTGVMHGKSQTKSVQEVPSQETVGHEESSGESQADEEAATQSNGEDESHEEQSEAPEALIDTKAKAKAKKALEQL